MKTPSWVALFAFLSAVSALAAPSTASAAPSGATRKPNLSLHWVDARGKVYQNATLVKATWVWSKASLAAKTSSPALRIEMKSNLPQDWIPLSTASIGLTLIEPFQKHIQDGQSFETQIVDLRSLSGQVAYTFVDRRQNKIPLTLAIQVQTNKPYALTHQACGPMGLHLVPRLESGAHLFVALRCVDHDDRISVYFFRSEDSKWKEAPGLVDMSAQESRLAFRYTEEKPKKDNVYASRLFVVGTSDNAGRPNVYSVIYKPSVLPSKLYAIPGAGLTYYSYHEAVSNIQRTQEDLTLRLNVGYRLIPKVLYFTTTFFISALTLAHSGNSDIANAPAVRWYGANFHVGYRLPIGMGSTEFYFLGGWYFWGMLVNASQQNTFGIQSLSGPQFILIGQHAQKGHHGYEGYLKYAIVADQLELSSLSNREITLGGGYELSKNNPKPFSLTVNFSQIQFSKTTPQLSDSMSEFSLTIGIQRSI